MLVVQTPGGTLGGKEQSISYFNWGWSYVVGKNSRCPELASLFGFFATNGVISSRAIAEAKGFFDPFRKEHFQYEPIKDVYGENFLTTLKTSLNEAIPDFYLKAQGQYFSALRQGIHAANFQSIESEAALKAVSEKWDSISSAQGFQNQKKQWQRLQNRYPSHLKRHLKG
ncbi:MAG: hypothetical protein HRU19_24470 [Pseudobacteriovorax sp.]|nr:hypothetical protein [Pseudobacteriovorax sp.]